MKVIVTGERRLAASPTAVLTALTEGATWRRPTAQLQDLAAVEEGRYRGRLAMFTGPLQATYTGTVTLIERQPAGLRLAFLAENTVGGWLEGPLNVEVAAAEDGAIVRYRGELTVGGTLATFTPRLLQSNARMVARNLLQAVEEAALGQPLPATIPVPRRPRPPHTLMAPARREVAVAIAFVAAVAILLHRFGRRWLV